MEIFLFQFGFRILSIWLARCNVCVSTSNNIFNNNQISILAMEIIRRSIILLAFKCHIHSLCTNNLLSQSNSFNFISILACYSICQSCQFSSTVLSKTILSRLWIKCKRCKFIFQTKKKKKNNLLKISSWNCTKVKVRKRIHLSHVSWLYGGMSENHERNSNKHLIEVLNRNPVDHRIRFEFVDF